MMEPLFSIVVPVYNVEKYLRRCLDSLLEQTFPFFEVLACNDGSKDNSLEILKEYEEKDYRVKVIDKKNGGVTSARQACLDISKGRYIVCVDGDDALESNCLEEFVKAIDSNDPDIVCCGFKRIYKDSVKEEPVKFKPGYFDRDKIENQIFPIIFEAEKGNEIKMTFWAKAVRKELFEYEHKLLSPKITIGEDNAVMIPCFYRANGVTILPSCLYNYTMSDTSVINNGKARPLKQLKARVRHYKKRVDLSSFDLQESFNRSVVHSLFNFLITQFYRDDEESVIIRDIEAQLNDKEYARIIRECHFPAFTKGFLALFALKHRCFGLMKKYSKMKRGNF